MSSDAGRARPARGAIVFEWLLSIGLSDAIPKFKQVGITTPAQLVALGFDDFERTGISELLDRKKLFCLVQKVKSPLSSSAPTHHAPRLKQANSANGELKSACPGSSASATTLCWSSRPACRRPM